MNCLIIGSNKKNCKSLEEDIRRSGYFKLVSSCSTVTQAKEVFQKYKINVLFVDEPGHSKQAKSFLNYLNGNKPHIIAVSSVTEVGKIVDFTINDFILKPFSKVQLSRVINKIKLAEELNHVHSNGSHFIFVKENRVFHKIATEDIYYIRALSDYVRIFTHGKVYTTYSTMTEMLGKLPEKDFLRVHRSFIVRIDAITQFQEGFLSIERRLIPIGKLYKEDLLRRLPIL